MYTVLAFCAHPDDIEESCGGTLLKCKARGDRVVICHFSDGDMGHVVIEPEVLGPMRCKEAKNSADLAGFECIYAGFHDLSVYAETKEARDMVVDVIREVDPDFIITHAPNDYMCDHNAVSKLTFDASFTATVPHYKTKVDKVARLTPIYYMQTACGVDFKPTEYVDITEFIDKKLEMTECHVSQMSWLREHDNIDFPEMVRTEARYYGYQCGAEYAECFDMCRAYLRGTTKRYLP